MKHAYIAPTEFLGYVPEDSNYHLLLAHLLSDDRYCSFYRDRQKRGDFIIIDNGAFEFKKPMDVEMYREMIQKSGIKPDVVVAPDFPFKNWKETAESTLKFVIDIRKDKDFAGVKVMGVPQSESGDHEGWMRCLEDMIYISEVDFIGISILGVPNAFHTLTGTKDVTFNRMFASTHIAKCGYHKCDVEYHFLGCGDPRELVFLNELGWVYGNDSSTAIWHGIQGIRFDDTRGGLVNGKSEIPVDFNLRYGSHDHDAIVHNIGWIRGMVSDD